MLATAAKLSRALAATLDVVLSELALEAQFRSFASDYSVPLPASAGIWADGFWQIVSIKEPTTQGGARIRSAALFCLSVFTGCYHSARGDLLLQRAAD
jgi:hypothetical protein